MQVAIKKTARRRIKVTAQHERRSRIRVKSAVERFDLIKTSLSRSLGVGNNLLELVAKPCVFRLTGKGGRYVSAEDAKRSVRGFKGQVERAPREPQVVFVAGTHRKTRQNGRVTRSPRGPTGKMVADGEADVVLARVLRRVGANCFLKTDYVGVLPSNFARQFVGHAFAQGDVVGNDSHRLQLLCGGEGVPFQTHQRPCPKEQSRSIAQRQRVAALAERQEAAQRGHNAPLVLRKIGNERGNLGTLPDEIFDDPQRQQTHSRAQAPAAQSAKTRAPPVF